ncbi:porin family protein [Photobacterium lipolyticum]|uniref:Outer membrane protein beta-barrel domain-containing protein n=1 Tax=Photobacterium lipolyticum TaxID=266810 RepID=A0A2T3MZP6_9GAMM|nr:porin family protein [Photobacterium lipolyticum]PSW05444.1 hypothetical protein C9I89_09340 [Photobacterium lipolyticum]
MKHSIALATAALLISPLAQANGNWYIGLDLMNTEADTNGWVEGIEDIGGIPVENEGGGLSLLAGYQYTPWIALEVGLSRQAIEVIDYEKSSGLFYYEYLMVDAYVNTLSVGTKMRYLTNSGFGFYAKPSIAYTMTEVDINGNSTSGGDKLDENEKNSTVHFNFEVGAEYFLSDSFSLGLAYERQFDALDYSIKALDSDKISTNSYKLGIRYYF